MFEIKKNEYINKTFRMDKNLVDRLSKVATDNDISLNNLIAQCCEYAIDNMEIKSNKSENNR